MEGDYSTIVAREGGFELSAEGEFAWFFEEVFHGDAFDGLGTEVAFVSFNGFGGDGFGVYESVEGVGLVGDLYVGVLGAFGVDFDEVDGGVVDLE